MTILREERIGGQRLILGDCREVMPHLGRFDAVVTDPPYGIGFQYSTHDDRSEAYQGGYGGWLMERICVAEAMCEPGSPVFIWQSGLNLRHFSAWFDRDWRLFVAAKNFVQMRPTAMQWAFDPVVVWWTPGKPWAEGTASRDFHVANTAPVIGQAKSLERQHPCPRPLDQVEHIVRQWVKPASRAIDPFMGSGTTLVACQRLGRNGTGVEIDPDYFEIACRRVDEATRQPDLFVAPPDQQHQEALL